MHTFGFLTDPSPDDLQRIIDLYRAAGWWGDGPDDPALVSRIIRGSHCFVVARAGEAIVGMGRALSDRASDAWIQDVTVETALRHRGIGTEIVRRIVARLESDGLGWIGLVAENRSHPLYEPLGFTPMTDAMPMIRIVR
jgi:ribosomal protein S18 acetylase RimI-like enzyme